MQKAVANELSKFGVQFICHRPYLLILMNYFNLFDKYNTKSSSLQQSAYCSQTLS